MNIVVGEITEDNWMWRGQGMLVVCVCYYCYCDVMLCEYIYIYIYEWNHANMWSVGDSMYKEEYIDIKDEQIYMTSIC